MSQGCVEDAPKFIASILKLEKIEKCSNIKFWIFSHENFCPSHYGCGGGELAPMKLPAQNIPDWLTATYWHIENNQDSYLKSVRKNERRIKISDGHTYDMIELVEHIKLVSNKGKAKNYRAQIIKI